MTMEDRIKTCRKKAGFTQKQLAEKCGMAEITIRQYESGKRQPRIEQLRRIAAALGVYISDLVDDWSKYSQKEISDDLENGNSLNESEKPLLENYRQLNQAGQEKAIEHVELLTKVPEYRKGK